MRKSAVAVVRQQDAVDELVTGAGRVGPLNRLLQEKVGADDDRLRNIGGAYGGPGGCHGHVLNHGCGTHRNNTYLEGDAVLCLNSGSGDRDDNDAGRLVVVALVVSRDVREDIRTQAQRAGLVAQPRRNRVSDREVVRAEPSSLVGDGVGEDVPSHPRCGVHGLEKHQGRDRGSDLQVVSDRVYDTSVELRRGGQGHSGPSSGCRSARGDVQDDQDLGRCVHVQGKRPYDRRIARIFGAVAIDVQHHTNRPTVGRRGREDECVGTVPDVGDGVGEKDAGPGRCQARAGLFDVHSSHLADHDHDIGGRFVSRGAVGKRIG